MDIKGLIERVKLTDEEIRSKVSSLPPNKILYYQSSYEESSIEWNDFIAQAATNKVLNDKDLALIDREEEQEESPNTELIIQHLSDILTTAEEHHDAKGNSNQTLFKMDLDRIEQAIEILKASRSIIPLRKAIKEVKQ